MTSGNQVTLAVLNPNGRDPFVDYSDGPGEHCPGVHPPVNFHAYAAATNGAFYDSVEAVLADRERFDAVLVLIRRRCWITLKAVQKLKAEGLTVLVAWKECGPFQISEQLETTKALQAYAEILVLADGILSPTKVTPPRWGWIPSEEFWRKVRFVPTPYPLEFKAWDFSVPIEKREGILVGTREFFKPTRNHLRTLARSATLAAQLKLPVTVINGDKTRGRKMLHNLEASFPEGSLRIIEGRRPYDEFLRLVSSHRLVFQLDRSAVPGQIAGDALLGRTLCAGGNSSIEEEAFPDFCDGRTKDLEAVYEKVARVLTDEDEYKKAVTESQELGRERVSFGAVAGQLARFLVDLKAV
ncbi:MAG: hypothetical protein HKN23_01530 [Verrucomicrobiales bacterium]|nr:hypothetical protein [Verrucomicrobiales bacterium]